MWFKRASSSLSSSKEVCLLAPLASGTGLIPRDVRLPGKHGAVVILREFRVQSHRGSSYGELMIGLSVGFWDGGSVWLSGLNIFIMPGLFHGCPGRVLCVSGQVIPRQLRHQHRSAAGPAWAAPALRPEAPEGNFLPKRGCCRCPGSWPGREAVRGEVCTLPDALRLGMGEPLTCGLACLSRQDCVHYGGHDHEGDYAEDQHEVAGI